MRYPDAKCAGTLTLVEATAQKATLRQHLTEDPLLQCRASTDATVTLTREGVDLLFAAEIDGDHQVHTARLAKR